MIAKLYNKSADESLNKHEATIDHENNRPLITFTLLAYNQEKFIREAVEGAFSQTYSPLEIILSDDCSNDSTFELMQDMVNAYQGPHKIVLSRNEKNLGIGGHYSKIMDMACGEIIELAAGDDISLPERTNISWEVLRENPEVMSVSLGLRRFSGIVPVGLSQDTDRKDISIYDISNFISDSSFHLNAPARAFRKHTHILFGPLNDECPVEDGSNLLRCLLHGKVAGLERVAVLYRIHGDNFYASENKYTIDFKSIFANYYSDIDKAKKSDLIDRETAFKCIRATRQREKKEVIKANFFQSGYGLSIFFIHILFSSFFSGRAKMNFFKSSLTSTLSVIRGFKGLRVVIKNFFKVSDYGRWSNSKSLKDSWDPRTIMIAKLIKPNSTVLEFGSGRMVLKKYLHPSCSYTPSDIIDRGSGTIVVDLNSKPYTFLNDHDSEFNVAVFSGVLEYIYDLRSLVSYLHNYVEKIVLSYAGFEKGESYINRRKHGWVNDYTYEELITLFENAGFVAERVDSWKQQAIFILSK